ncbi:MAG TPA: hypothetical protein VHZ97_16860 [Pseudonocardiaceae bacterium]|nr:hypothetical protein [Pseudonocardiaceae bacterium]
MRQGWWLLGAAVLVAGCSVSAEGSLHARPSDACTLFTSEEVAGIVGTPGPFTGAHEDDDQNGNPVWGCTWGTQTSYVDLREITAAGLAGVDHDAGATRTPLSGIGDRAELVKWTSGREPELYLTVSGVNYGIDVAVNRRAADDGGNADHEADAEQTVAKAITG